MKLKSVKKLMDAIENWKIELAADKTVWFLIDTSKAEPEVNWPGELLYQDSDLSSVKYKRVELMLNLLAVGEELPDQKMICTMNGIGSDASG